MNESLTYKTIQGVKWSYISTITTAIMQLGYTATMSRLLNPADFGLVAMGGVVLRFGQYFSQMGMSSALIQKKELSKENISAAFTSSIFLGLFFSILTYLFAPLTKYVFKNPDVVQIVKIMGLSFFINGFSLTSLALIRRNLYFKRLAISEIVAFLIGYMVIGIGAAMHGLGVWSLVFASLSQSAILGVLTFVIFRHDLSLTFSWFHYKPLLSFGSKISIISFLEFIGGSLDTILIGRFFGDKKLGYYNRSQMLMSLPMTYLITSLSKVLFPSFSKIQDNNEKIKDKFFLILKLATMMILPFATVVSILSKEIVLVILGQKWLESVNLLQILAFAIAIDFLEHLIAVLFEAKGFLKEKLILQISYILVLVTTYSIFFPMGLKGFTIALLISEGIRFLAYSISFLKKLDIKIKDFSRVFIEPVLSTIIVFIILFPIHNFFNIIKINIYLNLAITSFTALIIYIATLYLKFNEETKKNIMELLIRSFINKNETTISITR